MVSDTKSLSQQFRAALAADPGPGGPDDPTPAGGAVPPLVRCAGPAPAVAGFTGYAVAVDGEGEVVDGHPLTPRVVRLDAARGMADGADLRRFPWATHVVVNDHTGEEHYRRALRAA